ncbi:MAG: hypothetical protein WDO24_10940 [Pseudomonadota bacterium]
MDRQRGTPGRLTIPARDDALLLNFDGGGSDIPVYPLSDIYACATAGKLDRRDRRRDRRGR